MTEAGEDIVYICQGCHQAINKEVFDQTRCSNCGGDFKAEKAIEVGNIFPLKRSFAETFHLTFKDKDGAERVVSAGCYGLGISRVMGALVEVNHDDKGIVWPAAVAPYRVHLVGLDLDNPEVEKRAQQIYSQLLERGVEVLFDDRANVSAGEKFAETDLIGIPWRIVISKKNW